jgi:amino acid adenylation domain-containing protein
VDRHIPFLVWRYVDPVGLSLYQRELMGGLRDSLTSRDLLGQVHLELSEAIDPSALRAAVRARMDDIPRLRITVAPGESGPVVSVPPVSSPSLDPVVALDWSGAPANPRPIEERISRFLEEDRCQDPQQGMPRPAARGSLLHRLTCIRLPGDRTLLSWVFDPLLLDSAEVLGLLGEMLHALSGAETPAKRPPTPRPQAPPSQAGMQGFWAEALRGFRAPTPIPVALRSLEMAGERREIRGRVVLDLGRERLARLTATASGLGVPLRSLVLGAWGILLHRYSAESEVTFGVWMPGDGAAAPSEAGHAPCCRPVRIATDSTAARTWLRQVDTGLASVEQFRAAALSDIRAWGGLVPGTVLFHSTARYLDPGEALGDAHAPRMKTGSAAAPMLAPLNLTVLRGSRLTLQIDFDPSAFDRDTVSRMAGHLETLLDGVAAAPDTLISRLPLLRDAERKALIEEWNPPAALYPASVTLVEWFEAQVRRAPNSVALCSGGRSLTYGDLNRRANRLAHRLRTMGVGPDVIVGLCLDRSLDLVVGLLGILKAGGAYLPIDLAYPRDRLAFMLDDARAPVLVTQRRLCEEIPTHRAAVLCIDEEGLLEPGGGPEENPVSQVRPEHLAYVIYTSGSTGKPKGALVTHHNVVRLFQATADWFGFTERDVWTLFHSTAFDFSVWELWGALGYGGRLVVVPYEVTRSPEAFLALLVEERVTVLNQTPSAFRQLIRADQARGAAADLALRYVVFGGEALEMQSLRPWYDRRGDQRPRLINMYGITETTVHVTYRPLSRNDLNSGSVIGVPIPDLQIYILDAHRQPVPIGVPGELYVGGSGLARGYFNRPELTDERFIPNPFLPDPGARLYKTGDLARFLPGRDIEYLGRLDHQVKIRGFRIELGEIESILCSQAGVHECAVIARDDDAGGKRLVAYLVGDLPPARLRELRTHLAAKLPDYMVPAAFVTLKALPLTNNGKVDLRALPKPQSQRPEWLGNCEPPATPLERQIARFWGDVLQMEPVGVEDNFFDLGGNSLQLAEVHVRIQREVGREFPITELFAHSTVRSLAASLESRVPAAPVHRRPRPNGTAPADIAIVGMAGRFPGARSVEELWQNLVAGRDSIARFGPGDIEYAVGGREARSGNGKFVAARGVLDAVDEFDAAFFGIYPKEAELMDPQHRLFLECAWEALESAGHDPARYPGLIGVYAGLSLNTYFLYHLCRDRRFAAGFAGGYQVEAYPTLLGNDKDFLPTRVSYKLNLRGPSMAVQSGCSTSLVAVCQACTSLRTHQCDMALAGGVSISFPQRRDYRYQEAAMVSPDGTCRTFDAQAQGTVFGHGVGVVLLKRLADATADGDHILAVIRGTALNNDGAAKVGYAAPSIQAQADVIAAAQVAAGVTPESISYVEAHGTGTPLGDPIEVAALTQAFRAGGAQRTGYCALGSGKTHFGHLDAAAGVTGLIKTVLQLQNELIPPLLHYKSPNPSIRFEESPFFPVSKALAWKRGAEPRRAGVSAFGVGGTNAHVVVEEAPAAPASGTARTAQLLLLSARTPAALRQQCLRLADHLAARPLTPLDDVAYTLQAGRRHFPHRWAMTTTSRDHAIRSLRERASQPDAAPVAAGSSTRGLFLLPRDSSGTASWVSDVAAEVAPFRDALRRCAQLGLEFTGTDLAPAAGGLHREAGGTTVPPQPAAGFVLEYALGEMWLAWGLRPVALLADGPGEFAAAVLSGSLTLEEAVRALVPGTPSAQKPGQSRGATPPTPRIPWISGVTGRWVTPQDLSEERLSLVANTSSGTRIADALDIAMAQGASWFLEVGAGSTLTQLARQHPAAPAGLCVCTPFPSDDSARSARAALLGVLGQLWLAGAEPDWQVLHSGEGRRRVPLPTYPFERKRYWVEPVKSPTSA